MNRELEILDFTVMHNETHSYSPALKISKVLLRWDSYLSPCIDIHLEDVEVLVEFFNLLLTRNNWNALADVGFPPTTSDDDSSDNDTFLRIGSLNLLGSVKLRVWSKPLNQSISPDVVFNFESLKELMDQIENSSSNKQPSSPNYEDRKRKGSTTTEVYEIITDYFSTKLREMVKSTIFDLAKTQLDPKVTESDTVKKSKSLFNGAANLVRNYAQKTLDYTDEKVQKNAEIKLKKLGFDSDDVQTIMEASKGAFSTVISSWSQYKSNTASKTSSTVLPFVANFDFNDDEDAEKSMLMKDKLHWFKKGYQAATNAVLDKMIENKEVEINKDGNMINEIFFPPF